MRVESLTAKQGRVAKCFARLSVGPAVTTEVDTRKTVLGRQGLRNLAIQLQTARDDERLSVAREVHDELGQSLIALKLRLGALRARLSAEHHPLREQTAAMMALVDVG